MAKGIICIGSGGISSDECTATAGDVLAGKIYLGSDTDDETGVGTLALSGDAGVDNVLSGKTFYATDPKSKQKGTMANRGAVNQVLNAGGSYTIPEGYHNGKGKVSANSLESQTSANADAAKILCPYTAWVDGSRVTGEMVNRGAVSQTINPGGSYTIPAGYHNGSGKVTANKLGTSPQNIALVSQDGNGKNNSFTFTATSAGFYLFVVSMYDEYSYTYPMTGNFATNGTTIFSYLFNGADSMHNYSSVLYAYLNTGQYMSWSESGEYDFRWTGYQVFRIS